MKRYLFTVLGVALVASSAQATTLDYTTGVPIPPGVYGNSVTKTGDGVTVVLTGWSANGGNFSASQVRVFNTGIGSCASSEGINCPSGPHTVDNDGRDEVLLLLFSQPVLLTEAIIAAWANDYDASFWGGTGTINMGSIGFAGLGTQHDSPFLPNNAPANGTQTRAVSLTSIATPVDWLVFGVTPGQSNDKFKFKSLSFIVPEEDTPEPGTLLLLGIGTALLAARSRKGRKG